MVWCDVKTRRGQWKPHFAHRAAYHRYASQNALGYLNTNVFDAGGQTIPGHTRWNAMIRTAYTLLTNAAEEMQDYYDDRSEEWQEGEKAEALIEKMEQIQEAAENVSLLM